MAKFDSKTFNPNAFGAYVKRVPNLNLNALAKSRAIGTNEQAKTALSTQTGSIYATIPYFGRITGSTSQNNDGATDITSSGTSTYEQGFVVASRMDSWTEKNFSKNITAGVDFMDNVAQQIGEYKYDVRQAMLLKILEGIYAQSTSGSTARAKAAKEFIEKHTYDITGNGEGVVNAVTLNKAIQRGAGDNKNIFKLAVMHSEVATNLENLNLLEYLKYKDDSGIEQLLTIGQWNGRIVLIDDNMPAEEVAAVGETPAYTKYTTYVLGEGAIILDDIGDSVPYEMNRNPEKNGGQDTLYVRDRYLIGAEGLSFLKPSGVSVSNADLANGANWEIVNDGTNYLPHKAIPIVRIISRG